MDIGDYSTYFRGKAYTRWKRWQLSKFLAEMLEAGHTIAYYPQKGYWGVKYKEKAQRIKYSLCVHTVKKAPLTNG